MAKGKLILLFLCLFLFLIPFSSAIAKIGSQYNITISCSAINCSAANLTVLFPNSSTVLVNNQRMVNYNSYATYQITPTAFGDYYVFFTDGTNKSQSTFKATSTGFDLSTGSSIVYAVLILLMMSLFAGISIGISKLPDSNEKGEDGRIMSINWLKYLRAPLYFICWMLFIAILYITSNLAFAYLGEQLFAKVIFVLFRICFGLTPLIVIVWVISFFVQFFQDKKFQSLINRGIFPQGKI